MLEHQTETLINDALHKIEDCFPYFIPLATYSRFIPSKEISTFGISADLKVLYNESFCVLLDDKEMVFVILHEFMHVLHNHMERYKPFIGKYSHEILNIAADMEINSILSEDKNYDYSILSTCVLPEHFKYPKRLSMEQYLELMKNDMNNNGGNGDASSVISKLSKGMQKMSTDIRITDEKGEPVEMSSEQLKDLIDKCETSQKEKGNGSLHGISKVIEPKPIPYKWDKVLMNIVIDVAKIIKGYDHASYKKPSRRTTDDSQIIFPSWYKYDTDMNIVIIFDVSGSMYEEKEKVYGLLKTLPDAVEGDINIRILETDTEVLQDIENFDTTSSKIKSCDGGGTDLRAGWRYIKDKNIPCDLIVCLTDGYTDWPEPAEFKDKTVVLTTHVKPNNGYTYYHVEL